MNISGVNGAGASGMQAGAMGRGQAEDAVSKRLMQQIENAQKKLQEISGNSEISVEEKMKKRQEIQKEISELNKKKQAEHASAAERSGSSRNRNAKEGQVDIQISAEGMQAMISADGAMKQAKVQGSVAKSLKGRAGILKTEIEQDASRGSSAEKKREELAAIVHEMKEAAAGEAEEASGHQVNQAEGTKDESVSGAENISKDETDSALSMAERYNPIDIVL